MPRPTPVFQVLAALFRPGIPVAAVLCLLGRLPCAGAESPVLTRIRSCSGPLPTRLDRIQTDVLVAPGARTGVGAWVLDADGAWYQVLHPRLLTTGSHHLEFSFAGSQAVQAPNHQGLWQAGRPIRQAGVFTWGDHPITLDAPHALGLGPASPCLPLRYTDLDIQVGPDHTVGPGPGFPWYRIRLRPSPFPPDTLDRSRFLVLARICPAEGPERSIPLFHHQPMTDDGRPAGPAVWELRFRPETLDDCQVWLQVFVEQELRSTIRLPTMPVVTPAPARLDPPPARPLPDYDAPSLSIGLSMPSVAVAPPDGSRPPIDLARRLGELAASGRAVPVWLNARGVGEHRFLPGPADRCDRLLDQAAQAGWQVELVLAAPSTYDEAGDFLDLVVHLLGRYGDHPAVAGWRIQSDPPVPWARAAEVQAWEVRLRDEWRRLARADSRLRCVWLARLPDGPVQQMHLPPLAQPDESPARTCQLRAPLVTVVTTGFTGPDEPGTISAVVEVPADAPADLGVGGFFAQRHGQWYQCRRETALPPGRHRLLFDCGPRALVCEPDPAIFRPGLPTGRAGLFFWSAQASTATLRISSLQIGGRPVPDQPASRLVDLELDALRGRECQGSTGNRWELRARLHPAPANPYDRERTALDLHVQRPDRVAETIAGFWHEPLVLADRGDTESAQAAGPGTFVVRYRPRLPGLHGLNLQVGGQQAVPFRLELPPLRVDGQAWDPYVRIDAQDSRFLSTGRLTGKTAFCWPIGLNLRSVNDPRGQRNLQTILTPPRETQAYAAYLTRLAAAGGTVIEVWMSSWNLALEWSDVRPGYGGRGRYNQIHAARLDRLLDLAWAQGIRINLVIDNHGKASVKHDAEWPDNPWNQSQGGPLSEAGLLATDPQALAGQDQLRRYLVARFADHPAILGWKLWSEVDLTALKGPNLAPWHQQAARRWHELDVYDHPVTTHWCGTYQNPDRTVCALPELDYLCIDAYHHNHPEASRSLADLLWQGLHAADSLSPFAKPVVVTEFGGTSRAAPRPQLAAEHQSAGWVGLVSGYATSPLIWWYEWVDQESRYQPYAALSRFMAGEDLRGAEAKAYQPTVTSTAGPLWSGAWKRPGRILGYLADRTWLWNGTATIHHPAARLVIGEQVNPGPVTITWWDADSGRILSTRTYTHLGGSLILEVPAFNRHMAYKLVRG